MDKFMEEALRLAALAGRKGEVPIGAVIVKGDKIIARGRNCRQHRQNALLHAEVVAINKACRKMHSWRLEGCTMYVTLEPCPMCAGAIANARIDKVVFACEEKTACDGLFEKILSSNRLNHKVKTQKLEEYRPQAQTLLSEFFKAKR